LTYFIIVFLFIFYFVHYIATGHKKISRVFDIPGLHVYRTIYNFYNIDNIPDKNFYDHKQQQLLYSLNKYLSKQLLIIFQ
jgi:hypothetical protein